MILQWRDTLRTLISQFEARAARSAGLHHLFVEVADNERHKMHGPSWFGPFSKHPQIINGKPYYTKWQASAMKGLPGISPSFREAKSNETFNDNDEQRVIRDKTGVVRAVVVPMKIRQGYFCGQPSEEVSGFESLANIAATALADSDSLYDHAFASDLTEIFRKPCGGVRYVFGEVPSVPNEFLSSGWSAGVLQYENGVLIDMPISESMPDSSHWMLLLHRLGWRNIQGCGLRAKRWAWKENNEVDYDSLFMDWSQYPDEFSKQFNGISRESFYSVLGKKEVPLDVNLASVFAIQVLLADMSPNGASTHLISEPHVDYSHEDWHNLERPSLRTVTHDESNEICIPRIGILVATDVEKQAVLKMMRPPKSKRSVLQVYSGNNTCYVGRLGLTDIVLCMSAMGSVGRDASTIVTGELIQSWQLAGVIMVGIAFGKDSEKQQIGNVLVSDRVIAYEPERVGQTKTENRGTEPLAGAVLLNRFRNVIGWRFTSPTGRQCGFQIGPILSGEKLVDDLNFKRRLFERFPTAIGGEMEGIGVASAAERQKCEWIIVKAICDWGDGSKTKHHQGFAAASAVDFVRHALTQIGALDSLTS